MAAQSLSISVSRRSMLARGIAASTFALPPPLAPAAPDLLRLVSNPDTELHRRLALANRCWTAFVRSRKEADRLCRATYHHPEFARPPGFDAGRAGFAALAKRTGYYAAAARCTRLHDRYIVAAQTAFDFPARGLRSVVAKLRFGACVARDGMVGSFADNEFEWLDRAIDEFMQIADTLCRASAAAFSSI